MKRALSVPCPYPWCGAQPGHPCRTKAGRPAATHSARAQVAHPGPWNNHAARYFEGRDASHG